MTKRAKSMLNPSQILMPLCYFYSEANVLFFKRKTREREDLIFRLGEKEIEVLEHKKAVHQCTKTIDTRL